MSTTYMPNEAARWLYDQGAPWVVARAFGDYYDGCTPGMAFTTAKLWFHRADQARRLIHFYSECYGKHSSLMCNACRTGATFDRAAR